MPRRSAGSSSASPATPTSASRSLFNSLTGSSRETANCAGVTVDACAVCTQWEDRRIEIVDLPGSYSLDGPGDDQQAARRRCSSGGPASSSPSPTRPTWRAASTCRCSCSTWATASSSRSTSPTRRAGAGACRTPRCSLVTSASPWCPPSRRAAKASRNSRRRPARLGRRRPRHDRGDAAAAGDRGAPRGARLPHRHARRRPGWWPRRARSARRRVRRARGRRRRHA